MLHYIIKGDHTDGRPLLLLHGFLESSGMWNYLQLDGGCIAVDLPGHGKSDLEGVDSMKSMAERVAEVIDTLGISEYDVLGHSMGGYVALMLGEIDSRCQKLILMNSNVWSDSEEKKADRKRVAKLVQIKKDRFISEAIPNLFEAPEDFPEEVSALVQEAKAISSEAIARASLAMAQRWDRVEWVFSGATEVYIIQGLNDPIANVASMRRVMVNYPERYFEVETGHMAHIEATSAVQEIIQKIRQ